MQALFLWGAIPGRGAAGEAPSDAAFGRASLGCGALFLLRGTQPACKKQTAAPAPLRLFRPQDAPQLRSPARVGA